MAFTENNVDGLIYMSSSVIRTKHAFTTRFGGVSTGDFASLNLGFGRGDAPENVRENYRRLTALMGAEIDGCAVTRQVHGNEVRVVTRADRHECGAPVPYEADGIITTERGLPIMCFVADCVPALLCDADGNAAFLLSEKLPWLFSFIRALGQMSTPLALICLGGLFDFSKLRGAGRDILIGCALRVLIAPAVSLGAAIALNASGLMHFSTAEFACMVSVFASPLATVTGVMAAQMGSDDVYGDQLVVLTTLIGAFTLFITVCVMRANGFL